MWHFTFAQAVRARIVPVSQSARAITVGPVWRNPCQNPRLLAVEQQLMALLDGPLVSGLLQRNGYAQSVQLDNLLIDLWGVLPGTTGGGDNFKRAQLLLCVALRLLSATCHDMDALSVHCVATAMGFVWTESFRQTFSNTSKKFLLLLQPPPQQQPPQQQPPPQQQQPPPPPPPPQQPDDPLSASDHEMLAGLDLDELELELLLSEEDAGYVATIAAIGPEWAAMMWM